MRTSSVEITVATTSNKDHNIVLNKSNLYRSTTLLRDISFVLDNIRISNFCIQIVCLYLFSTDQFTTSIKNFDNNFFLNQSTNFKYDNNCTIFVHSTFLQKLTFHYLVIQNSNTF